MQDARNRCRDRGRGGKSRVPGRMWDPTGERKGPAQRLRNFGETREGLCGNWVSEARVACFSQVDWGGEEGGRG